MAVTLKRRLLSVEKYHLMIQAGIFTENDRVELLNGELIEMSPIGSRHAGHVNRLNSILSDISGKKAIIGVQNPIELGGLSEPEPDISVLKPDPSFYVNQHPTPKDIFLVIEVSATTLEIDRNIKLPIYAAAGIPVYWIVNLEDNQVEVYHTPQGELYKIREIFTLEDTLSLDSLDLTLPVKDILSE